IGHIFERICKFNGVDKRHTKPYHPWTNGMVERMNRTIKESTIKAYEYEGLEQLREHVQAFIQSYNFGKHLKALRWKTPFRAICEAWEKDPSRFRLHPHHLTVGLNIYTIPGSQFGNSLTPTQSLEFTINTQGQYAQAGAARSNGSLIANSQFCFPMRWYVD
ncbi:integrase core domain-containing protein, partial [Delftia acidovorans]|uniref:integrase core domain-containing protein n=1 Tax=Delftia acidovorans TaxID=80866 RepID=UPI0035A1BC4D